MMTGSFGSRGVGRITDIGASVSVGPGVRVGCALAPDPSVALGIAGEVPSNDTKGLYVGKAVDVAGGGSQAEKQIEKSIMVRIRRKKRMGMRAIVPNSLARFPLK